MKRNYTLIPLCLVLLAFIACSNNTKKASDDTEATAKNVVNVPQFNADSAYQYVKAQVDFGPRVPNTKAHVDCGNYLANKLTEFGQFICQIIATIHMRFRIRNAWTEVNLCFHILVSTVCIELWNIDDVFSSCFSVVACLLGIVAACYECKQHQA